MVDGIIYLHTKKQFNIVINGTSVHYYFNSPVSIHHSNVINVIVAFGSSLLTRPSAVEMMNCMVHHGIPYRRYPARKGGLRCLQLSTRGISFCPASGPLGHKGIWMPIECLSEQKKKKERKQNHFSVILLHNASIANPMLHKQMHHGISVYAVYFGETHGKWYAKPHAIAIARSCGVFVLKTVSFLVYFIRCQYLYFAILFPVHVILSCHDRQRTKTIFFYSAIPFCASHWSHPHTWISYIK